MLDNGADVNARLKTGNFTPLFFAKKKGHKNIEELLIANGAGT